MTLPQSLDRGRNLELRGRNVEPRIRLAVLVLLAALSIAGLANVFGQRTTESAAEAEAARLELRAPHAARGGLIYEARFRIEARRALREPALVLDPGWFDGLTINTSQPEPVEWKHRDGRNVMIFGPVAEGDELVIRLQYQVNPTATGGRTQNVLLEDGGEPLVELDHDMTLYP
jgi:hypothetical protein